MSIPERSVPVNRSLLRNRMFELGISERDLARRTGLGQTMTRAMLVSGNLSSSAQLSNIKNCLAEVGLTYGELFDTEPEEAFAQSLDADTDADSLAGLLISDRRMHAEELLGLALEWTLDRLDTAIQNLDLRLRQSGLRIHQNRNGVTIRSIDESATGAIQRMSEFRDDNKGIQQNTARVLYTIYIGTISGKKLARDATVQLGALNNRGTIKYSSGVDKRILLSDDCKFSFDVDL